MHIFVSGASGRNGRLVVDAAFSRGHTVTAMVRDPSSAALPSHVNLTIIQGSPLSESDIRHALSTPRSPDAVITTLNPRRTSESPFAPVHPDSHGLLENAMKTTLAALKALSLKPKIITNGSQGVGSSMQNVPLPVRLMMKYTNLSDTIVQHTAVEELVRKSGLRYVLARPVILSEGKAGDVRVLGDDGSGSGWFAMLNRASLTEWFVDAAESDDWDGKSSVVSN